MMEHQKIFITSTRPNWNGLKPIQPHPQIVFQNEGAPAPQLAEANNLGIAHAAPIPILLLLVASIPLHTTP